MADRYYCSDWYEEKPEYLEDLEADKLAERRKREGDIRNRGKEAKYLARHARFVLEEDKRNNRRTPLEVHEFARQVGYWEGYAEAGERLVSIASPDIAVSNLRRLYARLREGVYPIYDPEMAGDPMEEEDTEEDGKVQKA